MLAIDATQTVGGVLATLYAILFAAIIRRLIVQSERIAKLGERIAWLESRLNGKDD